MAHKSYKVSAPGSLMLMGEHAVLSGKHAIVCAISKRLNMQLTPVAGQEITITDTRLGSMVQNIHDLQIIAPFKFVLSVIALFKQQMPNGFTSGFNLDINSEFSSEIGFGSSAAVTVATVAVLGQWLHGKALTNAQIFTLARQAMLNVQMVGSGADLAASIFGGVLGYKTKPYKYCKLPIIPNLTAVYCGYKTPTAAVINIVNAAALQQPRVYASIFDTIDTCTQQAIVAIRKSNWDALGKLFAQHHGLQVALGVSDHLLNTLVHELSMQSEIYGAKISGSGLGDCVIGLGTASNEIFAQQNGVVQFLMAIDQQGLIYASN